MLNSNFSLTQRVHVTIESGFRVWGIEHVLCYEEASMLNKQFLPEVPTTKDLGSRWRWCLLVRTQQDP